MKNDYQSARSHIRIFTIVLIALTGLVTSCKEEKDELPEDVYLEDYHPNHTYTLESMQSLIAGLADVYPGAGSILQNVQYEVQVYIVNYRTFYRDSAIIASGLVCMPSGTGTFPVISFQNGTNTKHADAPSRDPLDNSLLMLQSMASNGYIVCIPDYTGFGASEDIMHPYYHKISSNNAVMDMLRALAELEQKPDIQPARNGNIYLMGYSQGGWATLSAFEEIERGDHSEFNIAAVSCGAGAYNLMSMSTYVLGQETYPGPLYLPYFIYGQQSYGSLPDPLDKYFNAPYAEKIPRLFNGSYSNDEVNAELTDQIADLVTASLIEGFLTGEEFGTLRDLLAENSIQAWDTDTRLRFYHGTADDNVPPEQSQNMYYNFMVSGSDPYIVEYADLPGMDHAGGVIPWGIATINWFNSLEGR